MKIKSLEIKNIGLIKTETIIFDKPLILFFGEVMQGKTTILNAVRWCFGGSFPSDIISHGEDTASIKLALSDGYIKREFYRSKSGETTAKKIECVMGGQLQSKPVDMIKKLLNPFLLDQNYFIDKTILEKKRYLLDLLDIDFNETDKKLGFLMKEAEQKRIEIKMIGDVDLTPCLEINIQSIRNEMQVALNSYQNERQAVKKQNEGINTFNQKLGASKARFAQIREEIARLRQEQDSLRDIISQDEKSIVLEPDMPDLTVFNQQIDDAQKINYRFQEYLKNIEKDKEKKNKEHKLYSLEQNISFYRQEKLDVLKTISDQSKIEGLSFNADGDIYFENVALDMLSNSQQMRFSSVLRGLYQNGFAIELIDRGESLGKSIYSFINKAKENDLTILATIVGEAPAVVDDEIGVFVVERGEIK
jgi:DNA repair exonuclease SbcCD ATPase subunit